MSLRNQLALAFFLVALASGLLAFGAGYLGFRQLMELDRRKDLLDLTRRVQEALSLTPAGPVLVHGEVFSGTHYLFGFQLKQGEKAVLEGGTLPQGDGPWRSQTLDWEGYRLEVYLWVGDYVRALGGYLRSSLLPFGLLLLLAYLAGHAVAGYLSRPLEDLARGWSAYPPCSFPIPCLRYPGGRCPGWWKASTAWWRRSGEPWQGKGSLPGTLPTNTAIP